MGKLEEKSDGNYILEVKVGNIKLTKAFKNAEKPLNKKHLKMMMWMQLLQYHQIQILFSGNNYFFLAAATKALNIGCPLNGLL